jgi:ferredoxin-thioredoxin reductase catalytic chain
LDRYGACYCALYVSKEILEGKREPGSIPESRPPKNERNNLLNRKLEVASSSGHQAFSAAKRPNLLFPVYRCKVCGYLCARENPPEVCPICKAKKDRFERFI